MQYMFLNIIIYMKLPFIECLYANEALSTNAEMRNVQAISFRPLPFIWLEMVFAYHVFFVFSSEFILQAHKYARHQTNYILWK